MIQVRDLRKGGVLCFAGGGVLAADPTTPGVGEWIFSKNLVPAADAEWANSVF
jgi:hypothetical protein